MPEVVPAVLPVGVPHVVVGALVRDGRVLLAHRRPDRAAYPDVWDLPGGHVEPGETELATVRRELREELGVPVTTDSASHVGRVRAGTHASPVVISAWLVADWDGTPTNAAPEEHDDLRWFALDDLPELAHPMVRTKLLQAKGFASP